MNKQHKIEQLEKALYILLGACDWEDVQGVGGEPLEDAIENANQVLKYVEIDSESPITYHEYAIPATRVMTLMPLLTQRIVIRNSYTTLTKLGIDLTGIS